MLGYPLVAGVMINGMGLVVGRYGRILRTTDGGITWTKIDSPTTAHLHGLSFNHENTHSGEDYDSVEENTGWAVGDRGTILQTDDRGLTWREITNDVISSLGTNSLKNGAPSRRKPRPLPCPPTASRVILRPLHPRRAADRDQPACGQAPQARQNCADHHRRHRARADGDDRRRQALDPALRPVRHH